MCYFRWNDTVDPNPLDADAVHEVLKKKAHANYKDIAEVCAYVIVFPRVSGQPVYS